MSAILILLGLFSLMLFLSNLGFLNKTKSFSFISIPIVIGYIFSPDQGLIPMLPSTQNNLSWAIRVALTWITFVYGTRLLVALPDKEHFKKLIPFFMGYIVFAITTFFILCGFYIENSAQLNLEPISYKLIIIALMLSSVIFSSKENPFLLPIFFFSLFFLFKNTPHTFTFLNLVIPLSIGILMAIVCRLIISPKDNFDTSSRLTLLGLCTLATGVTIGTNSLEVIVGLAFGWVMVFVHKYGVCKDPKLEKTIIPIKFVIAFFCGLYIHFSFYMVLIGVTLAVSRFGFKCLIVKIASQQDSTTQESLLNNMPISLLALPIILSLQLSSYQNVDTTFILSTFCVAFIINDLIALALEITNRPQEELEFTVSEDLNTLTKTETSI